MLFDKFTVRLLLLANRKVMAPLTRSRATPRHTPDALVARYFGQRATTTAVHAQDGRSKRSHRRASLCAKEQA